MNRTQQTLWTSLLAMCVAAIMAAAAVAADDEPDDLEGSFGVNVLDWEPILLSMEVVPERDAIARRAARELHVPLRAVPGLEGAWRALKPHVQPHDTGIPEGEPVLSAWRVDREGDSLRFLVHAADGEKLKLFSEVYNRPVRPRIELDALIPVVDQWEKDRLLDKIKVMEGRISLHFVSDKPTALRAPVDADEPARTLLVYGGADEIIGLDIREFNQVLDDLGGFQGRATGVYELRVHLRIEGNVSDLPEQRSEKTLDCAIRIAFVEEGFKVTQLQFDEVGKTDLFKKPVENQNEQ
jgi:hypothetical protein